MLCVEEARLSLISLSWPNEGPSTSSDPGSSTEARMLDYIQAHPGAHLRQLCRELGLAMGDVQYHVHRLEREGRITSFRRGLYRFFYASTLFAEKQRDILSFLSLDTPRELLLSLIEKPGLRQDELAGVASVTQPTISWHLKRLVDLGIVERVQDGRAVTYRVREEDRADIARFVRSYHPSAWERWSSRLADIFISYSGNEGEEAQK